MENQNETKYEAELGRKKSQMQKRVQSDREEDVKEKTGKRDEKGKMIVSWWNGGGKLVPRMTVNLVLKQYLETKADIFVYGEALIYRSIKEINLNGYIAITHKAQKEGVRRGIVVFYKKRFASIVTKERSSKKFDILWIRMKSSQDERVFAFFYAPGVNHNEKCREEFYDELRKGVEQYKDKQIYLMGDSNARLGEFSADKDINGILKSNKNKTLFLGFVEYAGMKYLNRIYELGKPTYEIVGKKRSVIDVALTNNMSRVENFEVMPQILGANAQTCHKIIQLTLRINVEQEKTVMKTKKKFRHCNAEALISVKGDVAKKCKTLRLLRGERLPSIYTYDIISRIYENAKVKYIGYRKGSRKIAPATTVVRTIQAKIIQTIALLERERRRKS